jgi:hypothetical protein
MVVFLAVAGSAFGQGFILNPGVSPTPGELSINISQKLNGDTVTPPVASVNDAAFWHVTVYRKMQAGAPLAPMVPAVAVQRVVLASDYPRSGLLTLQTSATYPLNPDGDPALVIEVNYLGGGTLTTQTLTPRPPAGSGAAPATTTTSSGSGSPTGCNASQVFNPGATYAHYCLSGSWVPQVGSHPLYSADSSFVLGKGFGTSTLGLRAQESVDNSVVLDPNVFNAAIFYQQVLPLWSTRHLMKPILVWNIATAEFDRKKKNTNLGTNVNLITAPEIAQPFSFGGLGVELDAGIEGGKNFKNNINPNGFGPVFRGLLGAQAAYIFFFNPHSTLKEIKIGSQYQVRIPEYNEVITRSVHGKLVPFEGHQARNWVSTEVDFMFTSNFGLTLKHDYGALPPGYVFIENRATIGLTVQSAQPK